MVFNEVYHNGMLVMSFKEPNFKMLGMLPWFANDSHECARSRYEESCAWQSSSIGHYNQLRPCDHIT